MDFNTLLLLAIIWLLWTIHQDLLESNDRQRELRASLLQREGSQGGSPEATPTKPAGPTAIERAAAGAPAGAAPVGAASAAAASAADTTAAVNINTASRTELQTLPRIGAASAGNIVAARPFTSVEQLAAVAGITAPAYEAIKDRVTV